MHRKAGLRHLMAGMSAKKGRALRTVNVKDETTFEAKMLKAYLPYK